MDITKLATTVRTERMRIGLTQAQLAERANVGKGRIEAIENDRCRSISIGTIFAVIEALGMSIELRRN